MSLHITQGDITLFTVDAIVNAANSTLLGGGGVDGCIHRAAGPELLAECRTLNGCAVGQAKMTSAYRLPCRWVIHTVGPIWHGGTHNEPELLTCCYQHSLELALQKGCTSIAFPLISAGVYGYPPAKAIQIAVETIQQFLQTHPMQVWLVLFGSTDFTLGRQLYPEWLTPNAPMKKGFL